MVNGWRGWVRQDGRDGTMCRQCCNYYKYGPLSLLTSVSPTPLICTICGSSSVLDGNTWLHLYNPSQGSILKAAMSPGYPDLYHPPLRISVQPPESLSDPRQDRPGRVARSEQLSDNIIIVLQKVVNLFCGCGCRHYQERFVFKILNIKILFSGM